ncbi:MAG TPA: phosphotransferase [Actinopolymorphaceae bacterium]
MDLTRPAWTDDWCRRELGSEPVDVLFASGQMSTVTGLELADGRRVVVKARPDEAGRATSCVRMQTSLSDAGMPVARPLTRARYFDGLAVHAEEWRPGGEMRRGDDEEHARASGRWLAYFTELTESYIGTVEPPPTNPVWVDWHRGSGLWPSYEPFDLRALSVPMPPELDVILKRARYRLTATELPEILGHADWETQNLRWSSAEYIHTVHDWDSLAWLPEAAIVGAASGAFASAETPTLAPVASSAAFIDEYQHARRRRFDVEEVEIAWAASVYPAAHNSRGEILWESAPVAWTALREQAEERLALGGARRMPGW